ncbi:MAG: hypothetical protein AB7V17_14920 [Hyphomonadaceae bacterium]
MTTEIVFVEVFDEGTPVFQGLEAEKIGDDVYRLGLPPFEYDPEDLALQFPPGSVVRCVRREMFGGEVVLVAVERLE